MRRRFIGTNKLDQFISKYLTIEALEDGLTASLSVNACEYCIDGDGNWKSLAKNTATESINAGQTLSFRGNLTAKADGSGIGQFTIKKRANLLGNCMSMLFGDNANDNLNSIAEGTFYKLFYECPIVSISNNFLPAIILSTKCYRRMFEGCTSLVNAPELPATILASNCYEKMFYGCTSLTAAPELPATNLEVSCYYAMFYGCTSLTTAPALPAITLRNSCYSYMFEGCSKLNYIKAMLIETPSTTSTNSWVRGVASSGTFVKNKKATWNVTGVNGVPIGWTIQKV